MDNFSKYTSGENIIHRATISMNDWIVNQSEIKAKVRIITSSISNTDDTILVLNFAEITQ